MSQHVALMRALQWLHGVWAPADRVGRLRGGRRTSVEADHGALGEVDADNLVPAFAARGQESDGDDVTHPAASLVIDDQGWHGCVGAGGVVAHHGTELLVAPTGPRYEANIGNFVNGESIENTDVVVWYGAHFTHDVNHEAPGEFGHVVGPELRNVNW